MVISCCFAFNIKAMKSVLTKFWAKNYVFELATFSSSLSEKQILECQVMIINLCILLIDTNTSICFAIQIK